jgi:hypothetical protein
VEEMEEVGVGDVEDDEKVEFVEEIDEFGVSIGVGVGGDVGGGVEDVDETEEVGVVEEFEEEMVGIY